MVRKKPVNKILDQPAIAVVSLLLELRTSEQDLQQQIPPP